MIQAVIGKESCSNSDEVPDSNQESNDYITLNTMTDNW